MTDKKMIIMVHGGFHWGGCFAKVANLLAVRGHPVAMPDLAGHGYDATPLSQIKTMADYTAPVARLIAAAQQPVVLVGHSMGGMTLSHLGERHPDKIARLVYLAAIMLPHGITVVEASAQHPSEVGPLTAPLADGTGISIRRDAAALQQAFFGDCSQRDVEVALANLTVDNPIAPFAWRSDITPQRYGGIPRTYIETLQDRAVPLGLQRRFQADVPGATVHTLDTSHSPFFSQSTAVAELIAAAAL